MYRAIIILIMTAFLGLSSQAAEPAKPELIDRLIENFDIEDSTYFDIDKIVDIIIQTEPQYSVYRETLTDFYTSHLTWSTIKPMFEKIFAGEFSRNELIEINKFLESPSFKIWMESDGDLGRIPESDREIVTNFSSSDTGIHFFKVTEDLAQTSNDFIGKVTIKYKDELQNMINQRTEELVQ